MKKIINDPTAVVNEMLDGLAYIHSDLVYRVEGLISSLARVRRRARLA